MCLLNFEGFQGCSEGSFSSMTSHNTREPFSMAHKFLFSRFFQLENFPIKPLKIFNNRIFTSCECFYIRNVSLWHFPQKPNPSHTFFQTKRRSSQAFPMSVSQIVCSDVCALKPKTESQRYFTRLFVPRHVKHCPAKSHFIENIWIYVLFICLRWYF